MDFVESLAKVSLFEMMKRGDLKRVSKLCRAHSFKAGEIITRQGDYDGRLFVVTAGEVEIIKGLDTDNELLIARFGQDQYFGEMALVDDYHRSASVRAVNDVELLALEQWDFREAIKKYPSIAVEMLQTLARRLRALEEKYGVERCD